MGAKNHAVVCPDANKTHTINALLGVGCSPISVIGVGGNSCSANPVCCTNNAVVRIRIYALNNYDLIFVDS